MLTKRIALKLFAITAIVLTCLVAWLTWSVRGQLRTVFIDQHGKILQPLSANQLAETRETLLLTGSLFEASELISLVLSDVQMDNLIDVSLFDEDGFLISDDIGESLTITLAPADLARALQGEPSPRYHAEAYGADLFPNSEAESKPLGIALVEVIVPLRDDAEERTVAMARYLLDGAETANDLHEMDRQLVTISGALLAMALVCLATLFAWAYRQSERSRRLIEESHQRLVELNHQLAFADKSSAVGSLSAHLIHGLKNPLAALKGLFEETLSETHAKHGKERVREMQRMIDHLVDVMRDEESELVYEYDLNEVRGLLEEKTLSKAKRRDVSLHLSDVPSRTLSGRQGNVLLLILVNLTENALEAAPPGSAVDVTFRMRNEAMLVVEIVDHGEGISPELRERLFVPKKSGKEQGTGIGLVISAQLARQIGGELQLLETDESGTTFAVNLPLDDAQV